MKSITEYIVNENLHDLTEIETQLTLLFSKLFPTNRISINLDIDDYEIDLSSEDFSESNQFVGILVENYLKQLLRKELNKEERGELISILQNYNGSDYGDYNNYDYVFNNICFEIKCSSDENKFYVSDKQRTEIGPDAIFILVTFELNKNNILLTDIIVKQKSSCKYSGKYLRSK